MIAPNTVPSSGSPHIDVAAAHPITFVLMLVLALFYALTTVAYEAKFSVSMRSLINSWVIFYTALIMLLMPITTGMALVILYRTNGDLRIDWIPDSIAPLAAAVFGVFGFEILFRRFVVGFGENQFELSKILQACLDQAVAATLKKEVG